MATLYGSGRVLKDALPQNNWKTEVWKDGIGNIDEEHNGLGLQVRIFFSIRQTCGCQTHHSTLVCRKTR